MRKFERVDLTNFTTFNRRDLFKAMGLGAAFFASEMPIARHLWANPVFRSNPFSLGVASGDPAPDGFVIWTKIAPEPLAPNAGMPMRAVEVEWEVAADDAMRQVIQKGKAIARPEMNHAVHVEVAGLEANREYFYRFRVGAERSRIGRSKTFPAAGADVTRMHFGVAGCQRYEDGWFTAFRYLADERFDFVYHYGDYVYEYRTLRAGERSNPIVRDMPGNPDEIYALADYRHRYALYKLDPDLQAAHASAPFLMSFDDHEVDNNWADMVSEEAGVPAEILALRRIAGFQAWYEHMPLRAAQRPNGPFIGAYRRLGFGNLAQIDVLDTRQYRSDQPCNDGWKVCAEAKDPNRTMLGKEQEAWLYDGFRTNTARWNVLAQQVPMMRLDRIPGPERTETHMDKWDGAEAARDRLFKAISEANIANPVVLTGDVHHNRAAELKTNFDDPKSKTIGVEFVATSISSNGDGVDRPTTHERYMQANPHFKFFNDQRGYVRHLVTPEKWTADYQVLEKVTEPNQPIKTRISLVTEAGKPGLANA
ncbi:PhoD Phosphodiesterase/alkaline phosphatase D [Rhabdaerophilaceae bacterium]